MFAKDCETMNSNGRSPDSEIDQACASASLGTRVRELRLLRKLSVEDLAVKVGLTRNALSEIESNATQPPIRLLKKLARALETSARYLAHGRSVSGTRADSSVVVPQELVTLALESHWSFAKVKALADARATLAITGAGRAKGTFSKHDWQELAGCLAPFMDFDELASE
jgi:transcriptional regulator with XRE-family HTH domain